MLSINRYPMQPFYINEDVKVYCTSYGNLIAHAPDDYEVRNLGNELTININGDIVAIYVRRPLRRTKHFKIGIDAPRNISILRHDAIKRTA